MPSYIARIRDEPAIREHRNLYGKGISPSYNESKDVVSISFLEHSLEDAESWLKEHEFSDYKLEENEDTKPTTRAFAFGLAEMAGRIERTGQGLTIRGVKLLAEGTWTDSMQKTPWRVNSGTLERYAANWTDDTVWNRHAGGQHRAVTDKIGRVENVTYKDGAVVGDVNLHGLTQNSRDAAALVEAGEINFVSVETVGKDKWNPGTREYEATDITFTGLALVNRGACKVCTLRENSEPAPDSVPAPAPEDTIEEDHEMAEIDVNALKDELRKELSGVYDGKIKELSESYEAKLTAAETRIKELEIAPSAPVTTPDPVRELAPPAGARVRIENGEVFASEWV